METNINSKLRDDLVPKLFTENYRIRFVEMLQAFEATLTPAVSSSSDPLAICMEDLTKKSELSEIDFFTNKLDSASDPQQEQKRLNFWLDSIRKLALQMRQMSLYSEEKSPPQPVFLTAFKEKRGRGRTTGWGFLETSMPGLSKQAHVTTGETNTILGSLSILQRSESF